MRFTKNILIILFLVIFDQVSKFYFFGKNIEIFRYFSFNFVANTGTIFGIVKNVNLLMIFISLLVIGFVFYYYKKDRRLRLGLNFVLAGAFGNLIDRIFRGYVVDFIDLRIWPVFNLADIFISFGVIYLLYKIIKEKD